MEWRLILAMLSFWVVLPNAQAILPSRCAWISSGLVGQGLIRNPVRSDWGKKVFQNSNFNTQVFYRAQDRVPLQLPAEAGSISALDTELAGMTADFESWMFSPKAKYNGIENLDIESQIEIADWQEWYEFRSQLYQNFKNSFLDRLETIKPTEKYEYVAIFSKFEKKIAFANPRRIKNLKSVAEASKVIGDYVQVSIGFTGELKAMTLLSPGFRHDNLLKDIPELNSLIHQKFKDLFHDAQAAPGKVLQVIKANPLLFTDPAFTVPEMIEELKDVYRLESFLDVVRNRMKDSGLDVKTVNTANFGNVATIQEFIQFARLKIALDPEVYVQFAFDDEVGKFLRPRFFPINEIMTRIRTAYRLQMYLIQIREAVGNHELDFFMAVNQRFQIIEVKNSSALASINRATVSAAESNLRKQVNGIQAILKFLGIKETTDYQILSFFAIRPEFQKRLRESGVTVR